MSSLQPPAGVIKQGFLVKKGHLRHNWRTRWFILTKDSLLYYKKRVDTTPAGVIPLVGASLSCLTPAPPRKAGAHTQWTMQLSAHKSSRVYIIQAPDLTMRDEWKEAIENCIRRLDPSKLGKDTSSFSRTMSAKSHSGQRDIVQAMQDKSAGVCLHEFKSKGSSVHYFTGKAAVDWLLSWSFASDRSGAITLASSILRHGFFHPVNPDEGKGVSVQTDSILTREFVDSEDAKYVFVAFAPGQSVDLFDSDESDSDSDDDLLLSRTPMPSIIEAGGDKILKQGFLLKKGRMRHNWKPRRFVLKDKTPYVYYYSGLKSLKPKGAIPLKNLTVVELDDEEPEQAPADQSQQTSRKRSRSTKLKLNRLALITSTGSRYVLEAPTAEDRNSWVSEFRIAIASQQITPL